MVDVSHIFSYENKINNQKRLPAKYNFNLGKMTCIRLPKSLTFSLFFSSPLSLSLPLLLRKPKSDQSLFHFVPPFLFFLSFVLFCCCCFFFSLPSFGLVHSSLLLLDYFLKNSDYDLVSLRGTAVRFVQTLILQCNHSGTGVKVHKF